jgi:hypothetical protein
MPLDLSHTTSHKRPMSTVHFVGGEKGGVGKSVVARALAQRFIDRQLPFAAIDADLSHGALLRYYSDYAQPVDLESFASADQILDRALGAERQVLVDLPAQSARAVKRWMDAGAVATFSREMSVQLVFWHVTDGGFDSVNELRRASENLASDFPFIVVKNFGRSPDFSQLEQGDTLARLVSEGSRVVDFPALDSGTMYKIDRFGSSFWAAINTSEGENALTVMERRRTQLWLNKVNEALDASGY